MMLVAPVRIFEQQNVLRETEVTGLFKQCAFVKMGATRSLTRAPMIISHPVEERLCKINKEHKKHNKTIETKLMTAWTHDLIFLADFSHSHNQLQAEMTES